MKANVLRTCCLVVLVPSCVLAVTSFGFQLARGFPHGIGPSASDWTGPAFRYSTGISLLLAWIYRKANRWMESRDEEASRLGARLERARSARWKTAVEALLKLCAMTALLLALALVVLVVNHGKPLTGGESEIVKWCSPVALVACVQALLRSRRAAASGSADGWDRTALIAAPVCILALIATSLGTEDQLAAWSSSLSWLTSFCAILLAFTAGYAAFGGTAKRRYTSRRHSAANRGGYRRHHA